MSKKLHDKLRVCRLILTELRAGNCQWTLLFKATLGYSPTPWEFRSALRWLCETGHVHHLERGHYSITDKGEKLLEALSYDDQNKMNDIR